MSACASFQQPLALFTGEPELTLLALFLLSTVLWVHGRTGLRGRAWARMCLAIGALVSFLIVGDLLDGAGDPSRRSDLLLAWLAMALLWVNCSIVSCETLALAHTPRSASRRFSPP